MVQLLQNHQVSPALLLAEFLEFSVVHLQCAPEHHVILKGEDRVVEVEFLREVIDQVLWRLVDAAVVLLEGCICDKVALAVLVSATEREPITVELKHINIDLRAKRRRDGLSRLLADVNRSALNESRSALVSVSVVRLWCFAIL